MGPIALVHEGIPIVLIATQGAVADDLAALASRLRNLGAHLTAISDVSVILETADRPAPLPVSVEERFCADDCRDCRAVARLSPDICAGA
jgi:glucosamine--fructose-6-phosphate aminotransferase (isomerizing)